MVRPTSGQEERAHAALIALAMPSMADPLATGAPARPTDASRTLKSMLNFPKRPSRRRFGKSSTTIVLNFPNRCPPIGFGKLSMF